MCYIQPQLRTELVQNVTGPGQRTKRDHFDMSKVGLSKVGEATRMAIDVLDPLRQVLDSRHAVQQFVPASLASGCPCFCSCGFHGCTSLLDPLSHLSSFALQPAHLLLPPLRSNGVEVSQKMALGPRAIFSISVDILTVFIHSSPEFGEHFYDHYFELFIR